MVGPVLTQLEFLSFSMSLLVGACTLDILQATNGTSTSLTLSLYLTDTSNLHYVVTGSHSSDNYTALDISALTNKRKSSNDCIESGLISTERAQSIVKQIDNLKSDTNYNVYLMVEVPESYGVFGPVIRTEARTHAAPPQIKTLIAEAIKNSTTEARLTIELDLPGYIYIMAIPRNSNLSIDISVDTLVLPNSSLNAISHEAEALTGNYTTILKQLTPAKSYDLWLALKSLGKGNVFGPIIAYTDAFRTHAPAPNVISLSCNPLNGRHDTLVLSFQIQYSASMIDSLSGEKASWHSTFAHYEVMNQNEDVYGRQDTETGRGFSEIKFRNIIELKSTLHRTHSIVIPVRSTGDYSIRLIAETTNHSGVYGEPLVVRGCRAHDVAPSIKHLSINPTYATIDSLELRVELERPGIIHYLLVEDSICACLAPIFISIDTLEHFFQNCGDRYLVSRGLIPYGPHLESNASHWKNFTIDSLLQDTLYHIVLFTETINSFGVISPSFHHQIRGATHADAGKVNVIAAKPETGRTDALNILLEMEKPQNLLIVCAQSKNRSHLRSCIQYHNHTKSTQINILIENLPEDTTYKLTFETHRRDNSGVRNIASTPLLASTYASAPRLSVVAKPKYGSTSAITLWIDLEGVAVVHYALLMAPNNASKLLSPHEISAYNETGQNVDGSIQKKGFAQSEVKSMDIEIDNLKANTTYLLLVMSETPTNNSIHPSLVFSEIKSTQVCTHAYSPKILEVLARPMDAHFDTIITRINLTAPGKVHYFASNYDFSDPNVIKPSKSKESTEHTISGQVELTTADIILESNESRPLYACEFLIKSLLPDTTYRVSITTQSTGDSGVFGDFPPPILVTTHAPAPELLPTENYLRSVPGSASTLQIEVWLQKSALVHYIIFLRKFAVTTASSVTQNDSQLVVSSFEVSQLTPKMLKEAPMKELGPGVRENGSISITAENAQRQKTTMKLIENLIPDALFEVCMTSESIDSNGIFFWKDSYHGCSVFQTFADYSNFSRMHDDAYVKPTPSDCNSIDVEIHVATNGYSIRDCSEGDLCRIETRASRIPYFILADGKRARKEFEMNNFSPHFSHFKSISTSFRDAIPGARNVVHAGQLNRIKYENNTHLIVVARLGDLEPNHLYYFFFAYESVGSDGVFTSVNPHFEASQQSNAIEITTYESAPKLERYEARAKPATIDSVFLTMDLSCQVCKAVVIHVFVAPRSCGIVSFDEFYDYILRTHSGSKHLHLDYLDDCLGSLDPFRLEVSVPESEHKVRDFIYDVRGLASNTSYRIYLITETASSHGVLSPHPRKLQISTSASAPMFYDLKAEPRKGSTTELILIWKLKAPGHVHYIVGPSQHPELVVTSPYNISGKGARWPDQEGSKYPYDAIKTRKTVHINDVDEMYYEVVSDLTAATNYTIYLVTESASSEGLYGEIVSLADIKTWSPAPRLLSHSVYPTHSKKASLSVGFRLIECCLVHVAVIQTEPEPAMQHVAHDSTIYGNRVALSEKIIARYTVENENLFHSGRWHEINVSVPTNDVTYDVYIVSETAHSDGVFGNVAVHRNVRCHPNPPRIVDVKVTATSAKTDSLTAFMKLDDLGNVHYRAVVKGIGRRIQVEGNATFLEKRTNDTCVGMLTIGNLTEGSCYHLYFRTETLNSFGVFGPWSSSAIEACTHKSPANILGGKVLVEKALDDNIAVPKVSSKHSMYAYKCDLQQDDAHSFLRTIISSKDKLKLKLFSYL